MATFTEKFEEGATDIRRTHARQEDEITCFDTGAFQRIISALRWTATSRSTTAGNPIPINKLQPRNQCLRNRLS